MRASASISPHILGINMPSPREGSFPSDQVPALMRVLHAPHFSRGDRAALKRMAVKGLTPLAFERFLLRHLDPQWQGEAHRPSWRTVLSALALQRGDSSYSPAVPLGRALEQAGYSELRLERLLGAEGSVLHVLALRAARVLAAKSAPCDWREFCALLFAAPGASRERINSRIAREFYRAQSAEER